MKLNVVNSLPSTIGKTWHKNCQFSRHLCQPADKVNSKNNNVLSKVGMQGEWRRRKRRKEREEQNNTELIFQRRCRWRRALWCKTAVAHLLGLRVWIPPEAWLSLVSAVCCQVEASAKSRSLVQKNTTEYDVSVCDIETSKPRQWGALGPLRLSRHGKIRNKNISTTAVWLTSYSDDHKIWSSLCVTV
jgi:hypothetical protein